MNLGFRWTLPALAVVVAALGTTAARAGDDGAAPIWVGISSIFGWGTERQDAIDYREHGKIVVPPNMDLPPPGAVAGAPAADWPVNQEVQHKKAEKEAAKKYIAGVGDARQRYTHPFEPNTPVTVRAADDQSGGAGCASGNCGSSGASTLGNLNPLNWMGMGKNTPLSAEEPEREWLTDPPKGFRSPAGPVTGQAAN
jgi:hypothetical protein